MQYAGDRWVQRLRDGETPPRWPLALGLTLMSVAGLVLGLVEITHPTFLADAAGSRGFFALIAAPPVLTFAGPVIAIATWIRGRQDRLVMTRIRRASEPAFFLPVLTSVQFDADALPDPRPTIWSIDADGVHGWSARAEKPVITLAWSEIEAIEVATLWRKGIEMAYGIRFELEGGRVVVRPRSTIGRPFEASATKIDILMRVVRSLRRQLDRAT